MTGFLDQPPNSSAAARNAMRLVSRTLFIWVTIIASDDDFRLGGLIAVRAIAATAARQNVSVPPLRRASDAGRDEQEIRKAVQIAQQLRVQRGRARKAPGAPLRASADRARQVTGSGRPIAAGQDEFLERRQPGVELVERRPPAARRSPRRCRDTRAATTRRRSRTARAGCGPICRTSSEPRSGSARTRPIALLVSSTRAEGLDAGVGLGYALAVGEPGRAVVARARIDLAESMSHRARSGACEGAMIEALNRPVALCDPNRSPAPWQVR